MPMSASRPVLLMAGGIAAGIGVLVYGGNDLKTPGIKNIENRHASAGGGHSSTPAQASQMGEEHSTVGRHGGQDGPESKNFSDKFHDQVPENSKAGKSWQNTMHDSDKGIRKS